MERMWAPWRMQYVSNVDKHDGEGCIFCTKPDDDADQENLILYRGTECFIILNAFPYNNGHLMVIPYRHTADIRELTAAELAEMTALVQVAVDVLKETTNPDGFNVGMNMGRPAGAGIDTHLHMHVVPRWNGDTNFMPVLGGAKVLSEALEETCARLRGVFAERMKTTDKDT